MKLRLKQSEDVHIDENWLRWFERLWLKVKKLWEDKWQITVSFDGFNQIKWLLKDDRMVIVEPGITIDQLNNELVKEGLEFQVPLEPSLTISEALNENALPSLQSEGSIKDHVEELTLLTGSSKIVKTGNYSGDEYSYGYHLKDLMIGSRNSLGFITEATLTLHPIKPHGALIYCKVNQDFEKN